MKKTEVTALVLTLLLPITALADEWTKEQQEVLAFEQACIDAKSAEALNACFHRDYVGWGIGSPVPLTKNEQTKLIADSFASTETELLLFKPLSVVIKGDMAVVSYISSGKVTDKRTEEAEYFIQRWTDVCVKDGGKWYWIADHGVDISDGE